jgi:SAM-dependent methyltransferase
MARQTLDFIGRDAKLDGYLEIGSTGRYVSELKDRIDVNGPVWIVNDIAPSYSPVDMIERESPFKIGEFVAMGNYDPFDAARIPDASVDLVTNFIGLHHCPTDRLEGFVASIRRVLRPGGRLLHRDHDVDGPTMDTFVALAHDVFNAGVGLTWEENAAQVRLFRSIAQWSELLESAGFRRTERALAQPHDPTQNLLLEFVKA